MIRARTTFLSQAVRPFFAILFFVILAGVAHAQEILETPQTQEMPPVSDSIAQVQDTLVQVQDTTAQPQQETIAQAQDSTQEILQPQDSVIAQDSVQAQETLQQENAAIISNDSLFIDFSDAIDIIIANNIDIQEAKYNWIAQSEAATGSYGEFEPHLTARAFSEKATPPTRYSPKPATNTRLAFKVKFRLGPNTTSVSTKRVTRTANTHQSFILAANSGNTCSKAGRFFTLRSTTNSLQNTKKNWHSKNTARL